MRQVKTIVVLAVLLVAGLASASAQSPYKRFDIGVSENMIGANLAHYDALHFGFRFNPNWMVMAEGGMLTGGGAGLATLMFGGVRPLDEKMEFVGMVGGGAYFLDNTVRPVGTLGLEFRYNATNFFYIGASSRGIISKDFMTASLLGLTIGFRL